MTAPSVWADQTKELTVEDMENMPDDEFRYELDDGMLIAAGTRSFRAVLPFAVTVTPSALVRISR